MGNLGQAFHLYFKRHCNLSWHLVMLGSDSLVPLLQMILPSPWDPSGFNHSGSKSNSTGVLINSSTCTPHYFHTCMCEIPKFKYVKWFVQDSKLRKGRVQLYSHPGFLNPMIWNHKKWDVSETLWFTNPNSHPLSQWILTTTMRRLLFPFRSVDVSWEGWNRTGVCLRPSVKGKAWSKGRHTQHCPHPQENVSCPDLTLWEPCFNPSPGMLFLIGEGSMQPKGCSPF